jgi:aldose 1-epimerase
VPPDAARVRLASGGLELELAPGLGGAIAAYRQRIGERLVPLMRETPRDASDVLQTACFPLVPYCNRIRDGRFAFRGRQVRLSPNLAPQKHPLHGQGWRGPWRVESHGPSEAVLGFDHPRGEWPWPWRAEQRFHLSEHGLEVRLSCRNTGTEAMPCGLGLHPFFDAPPDTILDASVESVWVVDDEVMPVARAAPTGRYSLERRRISRAGLDNGYEGWSGDATVRWPRRDAALSISSPSARRFQVYAPGEAEVLCAEPVENANDALSRPEADWPALGITVLEPGETATLVARFDPVGGV